MSTIKKPSQVENANTTLTAACEMYCRWYRSGLPAIDGAGMAYELVSAIRQALHEFEKQDVDESMRPDVEKIHAFAAELRRVTLPEVASDRAHEFSLRIASALNELADCCEAFEA